VEGVLGGEAVNRAIVTYAANGHEELLAVALPTYERFARAHGYDLRVGECLLPHLPAAWNKVALLLLALKECEEAVWLDCDLVFVNCEDDFPPMASDPASGTFTQDKVHALVRHFERGSEVPNSGVWRLRRGAEGLLNDMTALKVFTNHGWWEQAALMTLMGYCVPPEGSDFKKTRCKCVVQTEWHRQCQFMPLAWNSHPNYRTDKPRVVHCSYPDMDQRIEVMRALVRNPGFEYPRYDGPCPHCCKAKEEG
jgi:hypothetical protein